MMVKYLSNMSFKLKTVIFNHLVVAENAFSSYDKKDEKKKNIKMHNKIL